MHLLILMLISTFSNTLLK